MHARECFLHCDDDALGVDRVRGDECAFDHAVRVRPEQEPVLERTGLALGPVHDDGRGVHRRLVRGDGLPLAAGGEAAPAPAPQPGREHSLDHLGRVGGTGAFQTAPAAGGDVGLERDDRIRVENAMHARERMRYGALCVTAP